MASQSDWWKVENCNIKTLNLQYFALNIKPFTNYLEEDYKHTSRTDTKKLEATEIDDSRRILRIYRRQRIGSEKV